MKRLQIAEGLSLPLDAITQTFLIMAKRGMGKTYTAAVMTEEMLKARMPVVVLDPMGVWWGLRASANGKQVGLPITIFGGDHADVPLESTAGETIADLIVKEHISAVLDMSHFRKAEQKRFAMLFAENLYYKNKQALHLMVDEADAFAPQKPQKGEERMLGAFEDIVRRGRSKGLGVTLITQRSAVLNKNVLTQAEVLIALRAIAPQDQEAVLAWIDVHGDKDKRKKMMESLSSLAVGEAWFWSPGWLDVFKRVRINKRQTFDSSATPKFGGRLREPRRLAPVDLKRIREKIAATIERAKQEDPRELKRQIIELRQQLQRQKPIAIVQPTPEKVRTVEIKVPVLGKRAIRGMKKLVAVLVRSAKTIEGATKIIPKLEAALLKHEQGTKAVPPLPSRAPAPLPMREVSRGASVQRRPAPSLPHAEIESDEKLLAGERRMVAVLARVSVPITAIQTATLAGLSPTSGSTSNYFRKLERLGIATKRGEYMDVGQIPAGTDTSPFTRAEVISMWKQQFLAGERRMVDVLLEHEGKWISLENFGIAIGMSHTSGSFSNYIRKLKNNGLAEVSNGEVRLSETMFLGT